MSSSSPGTPTHNPVSNGYATPRSSYGQGLNNPDSFNPLSSEILCRHLLLGTGINPEDRHLTIQRYSFLQNSGWLPWEIC